MPRQLPLNNEWMLLRTKDDPTTNDPAWMVADIADPPDDDICGMFGASHGHEGRALTGIEVLPIAVVSVADRTQVTAGTGTIELRLIEVVERPDGSTFHRSVGEEDGTPIAVPLNDTCYFPVNGSRRFTVEASTDANYPGGSAALEMWVRSVTR